MADRTFEMELDRQFSEAPALPDSDAFALRVTEKLNRGWGVRQIFIGGLGLAGGLIGAGQILNSGLLSRAAGLGRQVEALVGPQLDEAPIARSVGNLVAIGSTMDGQILWMSAALGALAVGLFITRAIREI